MVQTVEDISLMQKLLDDSVTYAKSFPKTGAVASYIPELAKADPTRYGAAIALPNGRTLISGDTDVPFTMQSISKVVSLILALQTSGYDAVFKRVGMEPTGDAFNSIIRLETNTAKPSNPMINAGAIVVASCIQCEHPFEAMLQLTRKFCGNDQIGLNEAVYLSEKKEGKRNRAMAYFMQSEGILPSDVDVEYYLDQYFRMCSVAVTAPDLARMGMVLANNGVNPVTGERVAEGWQVRIAKTFMVTCGLYDSSVAFAVKVGIPSKSGVGGGILSAVEKRMGIGVFHPMLDAKGNSIGGVRMLEFLSERMGLHMFSEPETVAG